MERHLTSWYSPRLEKEMPIAVYGSYGFALLLIPTAAADFLEYERFQLIESLRPFIDGGKVKVFSIDSINLESWMNHKWIPIIKCTAKYLERICLQGSNSFYQAEYQL